MLCLQLWWGGCLAGHGDDYFSPAREEVIIERLDEGKYPSWRDYMIGYLRKVYGVDYLNKD